MEVYLPVYMSSPADCLIHVMISYCSLPYILDHRVPITWLFKTVTYLSALWSPGLSPDLVWSNLFYCAVLESVYIVHPWSGYVLHIDRNFPRFFRSYRNLLSECKKIRLQTILWSTTLLFLYSIQDISFSKRLNPCFNHRLPFVMASVKSFINNIFSIILAGRLPGSSV